MKPRSKEIQRPAQDTHPLGSVLELDCWGLISYSIILSFLYSQEWLNHHHFFLPWPYLPRWVSGLWSTPMHSSFIKVTLWLRWWGRLFTKISFCLNCSWPRLLQNIFPLVKWLPVTNAHRDKHAPKYQNSYKFIKANTINTNITL